MPRFRVRFLHSSLLTGRTSFQASGSPCVVVTTGSPYILARVRVAFQNLSAPFWNHSFRSAFHPFGIEQIRKLLFRVCGTPPIQLVLHVENKPGIHRAGHMCVHIACFLLTICIHCLPSPILYRMLMWTAFPPSDYSTPHSCGHLSLRSSSLPMAGRSPNEVPRFR